jgi:BirA family transcriptional regulator, biotin operon repressor / biotin---[acetyl-CoA-carboxylase] ligase
MSAAFGRPRHHFRGVESTNDVARELAADGAPSGTVVTASEQSAGRGRQGRIWTAPPGKALLLSAILRPLTSEHRLLPLAVPLAVSEAVEALGGSECRVKWPNDVWIDGRKAAGILIEARPPEWAVIGVGLNVAIERDEFPEELRESATSVGGGASVQDALEAVCERLERWVGVPDREVLDEFRARDALAGRPVRWVGGGRSGDGEGLVRGVDRDGNLVVERPDGSEVALGSGEVHLKAVSSVE